MIRKGAPYNSINLLYLFFHWIIILLLLLVVVKPLVNIITLVSESKYELFENFPEEIADEKKEDSRGDEKIRESGDFKTNTFLAVAPRYFDSRCYHLSFIPDIDLPPPKL